MTNDDMDLFEVYSQERLFLYLTPMLLEYCQDNTRRFTPEGIWSDAKDYCVGITDSVQPILKIKRKLQEIKNKSTNRFYEGTVIITPSQREKEDYYSILAACIYCMIIFSCGKSDLKNHILKHLPFDDIVGNTPSYRFFTSCVEQCIAYTNTLRIDQIDYDYTAYPEPKDEQTEMNNENPAEDPITAQNKPRLELVARLLEAVCGPIKADKHSHNGKQAAAARLASIITGLKESKCNDYMSARDYSPRTAKLKEDANKINAELEKLGIEIRL